jgi:hypothetical protein
MICDRLGNKSDAPRVFLLSGTNGQQEKKMKNMSLAIVALVMLQQAALAQESRRLINSGLGSQSVEDMIQMRADGESASASLVEKPHSCAPDVGEPVWGPSNALIGYKCVPPYAGGG